MNAPKRPKRMARLPDNVVRLPGPDYHFKPYGFRPDQIIELYDNNRAWVVTVERILALDDAELKRRLPYLSGATGGKFDTDDLISSIPKAGGAYEALGELFSCAAARLTVIEKKLV
jgi:hypothetical protein